MQNEGPHLSTNRWLLPIIGPHTLQQAGPVDKFVENKNRLLEITLSKALQVLLPQYATVFFTNAINDD